MLTASSHRGPAQETSMQLNPDMDRRDERQAKYVYVFLASRLAFV